MGVTNKYRLFHAYNEYRIEETLKYHANLDGTDFASRDGGSGFYFLRTDNYQKLEGWKIIGELRVPDTRIFRWLALFLFGIQRRLYIWYIRKKSKTWYILYNFEDDSFTLCQEHNVLYDDGKIIHHFEHYDFERARLIFDKFTQSYWIRFMN